VTVKGVKEEDDGSRLPPSHGWVGGASQRTAERANRLREEIGGPERFETPLDELMPGTAAPFRAGIEIMLEQDAADRRPGQEQQEGTQKPLHLGGMRKSLVEKEVAYFWTPATPGVRDRKLPAGRKHGAPVYRSTQHALRSRQRSRLPIC
jgi:hypothetical protein